MKRITCWSLVLMMVVAGMATFAFAGTKHEFDKVTYGKIVKKTIGGIVTGNVNPEKMIEDMETLIEIGIAGCKEHMREPETPRNEAKTMQITIDNAHKMKSLTLDEIEAQWHEGGVLKSNGINIDQFNHFAEVMCHYDAVVHPATAIIALEEYKKNGKKDLLEQVKAELAEAKEHLKHLE